MLPAIAGLQEKFRLAGVASRSPEKAVEFADEFKTTAFKSYEQLLDHEDLDAVYIPLPVGLHAEWIDRALDRGCHVLVEKSLASTPNEVHRLCDKAAAANLALVENFQFRFHPQLAQIKELLQDGAIGELRCVRSSFGCPPFPDKENIRYRPDLGGGALLDMGAYTLKISQEFLGPDISVVSAVMNAAPGKLVDIWGGGLLRQNNEPCFSEIAYGFDLQYQCSLELWGSKGRLFTNRIFTAPPGYAPVINLEDARGRREIPSPAANHFVNMLNHFYELTQHPENAEQEYCQNIRQSELIGQFRECANG